MVNMLKREICGRLFLFSFVNDIGERGKLTGQMAVRKPLNSKPASIAGGSPPPALAGSGRTP